MQLFPKGNVENKLTTNHVSKQLNHCINTNKYGDNQ